MIIAPSGSRINPSWFTLGVSRGIESQNSTAFMRATVLALDVLIYTPALLMFVRVWQANRSKKTQVFISLWVKLLENNISFRIWP